MITAKNITGRLFHHTVVDVDTLHMLVKMLPPNPVIVNIGACFGTSTLAMLEARPDAFIFSIDVKVCPKEREHIELARCDMGRVVRVLGLSQDAGVFWPYKVDMVFVDGNHGYSEVRQDIQAWRDKARGILAFHDYGKAICPEVKPAVDDGMKGYAPFIHIQSIMAFRME